MSPHPMDAALLPAEPGRWSAMVFQFKARCFQMRRLVQDTLFPVNRHPQTQDLDDAPVLADWSSDLWAGCESPRERQLQLGKVQNLRVSAKRLHGLEIPAGATWSFWKQLGRTTRGKGYAEGRELREGCIIPQTGGGLCQLSGAIYNAALEAGLEIVERHAHSNAAIGSLALIGRDATVFWNYVDLRLRHPAAWRLEVWLTENKLQVRIRSAAKAAPHTPMDLVVPGKAAPLNTCATCGLESCFRSSPLHGTQQAVDRTAVLVDGWWPEWDSVFEKEKEKSTPRDLFMPLDGRRWKKANYQWDIKLHETCRSFTWLALRRAWATRKLRNEGARRQRALLAWDERLAAAYALKLKAHHSHLIVCQTLLPWLWRDGWLGGRTFDVLMSRLPLQELHDRLDHAARLHPESGTCADFRASEDLLKNEKEALAAATRWITPHSEIAGLAGGKTCHIPWTVPAAAAPTSQPHTGINVVFPATTLCRKGAYELRQALSYLINDFHLELRGGVLEGADFWQGIPLHASRGDWLAEADAVVLPAFVEHCPRQLLKALGAGRKVIASTACGLHGLPGVTEVIAGDAAALHEALRGLLTGTDAGMNHPAAKEADAKARLLASCAP